MYKDTKVVCLACSCPCDIHKEHTHGNEQRKDKPENKNICMACSCPCEEHKKHTCKN